MLKPGSNMQVEEAAGERHRQLACHVEELERQLEGATQDLEEWQGQAADANEHAQELQQQLQDLSSRAERAEVRSLAWVSWCSLYDVYPDACACQSTPRE